MSNQKEDYDKKAKEIHKILNDFRKNPRALARHLEGLKKHVDNNNVLTEPGKIPIQMVEGVNVLNEAIQFLAGLKPLPPLILDPLLCQSAKEHVEDIGPKGLLSYQSSDGTEPEDRIGKYGNYIEALGENIDFGPNDALGVIVSLTLDDGEEERPHRDNLFKADYKKVGIACGAHKSEYQMCVMDFAYDFVAIGEENNEEPVPEEDTKNVQEKVAGNSNQYNQNQHNQPQQQHYMNMNVNPPLENSMNQNPSKQFTGSKPYNNTNQSPIVNVNIESQNKQGGSVASSHQNLPPQSNSLNELSQINSKKKIVSRYVEVITKVVLTYEDGSKKETTEKQDHTENY